MANSDWSVVVESHDTKGATNQNIGMFVQQVQNKKNHEHYNNAEEA